MPGIRIVALYYYPIKSCRGIKLDHAQITKRGIENDRVFMLTDPDGQFITQRKYPRMALISPQLDEVYLKLSAPNMPDVSIKYSETGTPTEVQIWQDSCLALDQGDEVADWLCEFLGINCRLVKIIKDTDRLVSSSYRISVDNQISFADGFPFLLTSVESLNDLSQRINMQLPMNRFRPNIVIKGAMPYAEDSWQCLRIRSTVFTVAKPCERCVITTVDQETGLKGKQPLKELKKYRTNKRGNVEFGQNLIHHSEGEICVDDAVEIVA